MTGKREFRKLKGEIRTEIVDGKRKIVGYGAVFNQLSEPMRIGNRTVRERVMPGAFDRCLRSSPDIRGLINHDPNLILGRTKAGTMSVSVDSHGARYEIDPPNTSYASDLMESLDRGDIDQSSFGFYTVEDGYVQGEDGQMVRELREVDCFDMSPVTYPAYPGASSGVRAAEEMRSMFPDGIPESLESEIKMPQPEDQNQSELNVAGISLADISGVRKALVRFNQVQGLTKEQRDAAWSKIVAAANTFGIAIDEENAAKLQGASYRDAKAMLREIDVDGDGDDDEPLIDALCDARAACATVCDTASSALWTFWNGDSELSNPLLRAFAEQSKVLIARLTSAMAEVEKELAEPNAAPELNSRKQRYRDLFIKKN